MAQVYVKYNPYRLETSITVNGREVPIDSSLYKVTRGKRLQEWIGLFPRKLREELNTVDLSLEFYGTALDWDDFENAFDLAAKDGIVKISDMRFIEGKSDDNVAERIERVFEDLKGGPIEDFRDKRLVRAFEDINNSVFPINVIATMSSGKSTLINALLQTKLMPSKNEACTATITEILDTDSQDYSAAAYSEDNRLIREEPHLTYEIMDQLNDDANVYRVCAEGNIPFLDSKSTALMLVDTPGPNNSQNQAHKNTTYRAINNDANNLILYILNGTQLQTNDDAALLQYIAEQIRKGGKQIRDRFLFVVNKMDQYDPEEENVEKVIDSARSYLARYGIEDPQLYPCSAYTALNIRTYFNEINIDELTRAQEKALPPAARETLVMIDKLIDYESMHLEKYTTLSPSAQQELNYRLSRAVEAGDTKEQALIHSGICSIEAAITAYVKKYAKTKKIKDLVETFQEVLESSQTLARAKAKVANDQEAARAIRERSEAIRKKINDGQEAAAFRERIHGLDPMPDIREKAAELEANASAKTTAVFRPYGDTITSRDEAKRLVQQFANFSSDAMAELTAELESAINSQIVAAGNRLLAEYQEKLTRFDSESSGGELDFKTVDLVKGALTTMRETARSWTTDDFAAETVDEAGEVTTEDREIYIKTGQKEEKTIKGSHKEKIGTRKVKTGSHREMVGTRRVPNPDKRWWKFFTPRYIEEAVYADVDDFKDEDVYETVLEYQTVMKDVYEKKTEHIEKFSASTLTIQTGLVAKMRTNLEKGIKSALEYADEQVKRMKEQFTSLFDSLDKTIQEKYEELDRCAGEEEEKEGRLKENTEILNWIEANIKEINDILEV